MKVQPIRNGTVIDHINPGMALKVLRILAIPQRGSSSIVSALINVPTGSKNGGPGKGHKDIVKIEDRELRPKEVNKIALIAPRATINIIREYEVAEKHAVRLPDYVAGIVRCGNPNCITNQHEPVEPAFFVESRDPPRLRCEFCDREQTDVAEQIL